MNVYLLQNTDRITFLLTSKEKIIAKNKSVSSAIIF